MRNMDNVTLEDIMISVKGAHLEMQMMLMYPECFEKSPPDNPINPAFKELELKEPSPEQRMRYLVIDRFNRF